MRRARAVREVLEAEAKFLRAAENDFEGTRMTIPRARDATGQGGDGGGGLATVSLGIHSASTPKLFIFRTKVD